MINLWVRPSSRSSSISLSQASYDSPMSPKGDKYEKAVADIFKRSGDGRSASLSIRRMRYGIPVPPRGNLLLTPPYMSLRGFASHRWHENIPHRLRGFLGFFLRYPHGVNHARTSETFIFHVETLHRVVCLHLRRPSPSRCSDSPPPNPRGRALV